MNSCGSKRVRAIGAVTVEGMKFGVIADLATGVTPDYRDFDAAAKETDE